MKNLLIIIVVVFGLLFLYKYNASTHMQNNFKLGEVINYKNNPEISINDITIKYLGSTPWIPATAEHVALSGTDKFEVTATSGKSISVNWATGTGELPGPTRLMTNDGCYELYINVIENQPGLKNIPSSLVLYKAVDNICDKWAKDLR